MTSERETPRETVESSRDSISGAGWSCKRQGIYKNLVPERPKFSWFNLSALWQSRNQLIARYIRDPTNDERRRWVARLREICPTDFIADRYSKLDSLNFLVLGDPGEGDASQFSLVEPLLTQAKDTQFMIICGDVVYPAGDVNQYEQKFYLPYRNYPDSIYAVPGNHDWQDGLNGFMVHFCGIDPDGTRKHPPGSNWLLKLLWREAAKADPMVLERCRDLRPKPVQRLKQPGPYFAIETGPLRIVDIDVGLKNCLDRDQGEWLRRISSDSSKPKLLLTGKPIYANGEYYPIPIEGGGTVDEIVRAREHNYVAVIGGNKHNYQRYSVKVGGEREIQHVVSGGGGAFMHATHQIPKVKLPGVREQDFVCYPLRGDSLSFYSMLYDKRFGFGRGWFYIPPDEAAALMAERIGVEPTRETDRRKPISRRARWVASILLPLLGRDGGPLHSLFSGFFDWDEPPLFKSFMRVEVTTDRLTLTCFGVTGCLEQERNPPIEDRVEIDIKA